MKIIKALLPQNDLQNMNHYVVCENKRMNDSQESPCFGSNASQYVNRLGKFQLGSHHKDELDQASYISQNNEMFK
jgi:hypothetical protein